jgi:integrase
MLPTQQLLEKVSKEMMAVPNRQKESKRGVHFCLFLLGYKSGLRISEAVSFDLTRKNKQGLYRISKPKGKKERLVYIPKQVIRELKKHSWKPNQTNRFNFYHFLRKIRKGLNISPNIELSPHTLRRAFTTYYAENGLSLPILSKILGHSSIRTTALY